MTTTTTTSTMPMLLSVCLAHLLLCFPHASTAFMFASPSHPGSSTSTASSIRTADASNLLGQSRKTTRLEAAFYADDGPTHLEAIADNVFSFLDDVSSNGQKAMDDSVSNVNQNVGRYFPPNNDGDDDDGENNSDGDGKAGGVRPKPPMEPPRLATFGHQKYEEDAEARRRDLEHRLQQEQIALRAAQQKLQNVLKQEEQLMHHEMKPYMYNGPKANGCHSLQQHHQQHASISSAHAQQRSSNLIETSNTQHDLDVAVHDTSSGATHATMNSAMSSTSATTRRRHKPMDATKQVPYAAMLEPAMHVESPPEGVPALFEWHQDEWGCIAGRVRGSFQFREGAKVKTSPVVFGASGGTVVTTASGSRYFLEHLAGQSSNDATANRGDEHQASPSETIVQSERVANGFLISTQNGHRYKLYARTSHEFQAVERITRVGMNISISSSLRRIG